MTYDSRTKEAAKSVDSIDWLAMLHFVANEAQRNPMESVRDMLNEAFDDYGVGMYAEWSGNEDMPISIHANDKS